MTDYGPFPVLSLPANSVSEKQAELSHKVLSPSPLQDLLSTSWHNYINSSSTAKATLADPGFSGSSGRHAPAGPLGKPCPSGGLCFSSLTVRSVDLVTARRPASGTSHEQKFPKVWKLMTSSLGAFTEGHTLPWTAASEQTACVAGPGQARDSEGSGRTPIRPESPIISTHTRTMDNGQFPGMGRPGLTGCDWKGDWKKKKLCQIPQSAPKDEERAPEQAPTSPVARRVWGLQLLKLWCGSQTALLMKETCLNKVRGREDLS